jgi:hypothetical protein
VAKVVDKALAKNPAERYQRGKEMADDLRAAIASLGTSGTATSASVPPPPPPAAPSGNDATVAMKPDAMKPDATKPDATKPDATVAMKADATVAMKSE